MPDSFFRRGGADICVTVFKAFREKLFFEVGGLKYNMDLDAYKVDDVEYLIDYANDYANGTNPDFDGKGDCTVDCSVEEL